MGINVNFQKKNLSSLLMLGCALWSAAAQADDPSLATAQECTRHLPTMERLYNIPAHWLAAIASTESGRYSPQLRLSVPWPWTINVAGQGHWFDTKQEAIQAVQKYQAQGIKSIDVGCMQVNLMYHGENFANLSQAFEPIYNISYAAKFLRSHYNNTNSWTKATAAYHSMQSSRGADYYRKVYQKWQQVVDRLNESVFAPPVQQAMRAPQPERPSSFAFREPAGANGLPSTLPFRVATPRGDGMDSQVKLNSITVSRGNIPSPQAAPQRQEQPTATVSIADNQRAYDRMQAAMPPTTALTPLDVLPQSGGFAPNRAPANIVAIPRPTQPSPMPPVATQSLDSPPSRNYERGVLVIRPNQPSAAEAANQPAQVRLTSEVNEPSVNRGQFSPQAVESNNPDNGGYVTDRAQPKTATPPKFVF